MPDLPDLPPSSGTVPAPDAPGVPSAAAAATPDGESADEFLLRHDVFVRKARDAAHQALWFLGFCHPSTREATTRAAVDYLPFALRQVRALVRSVYLRVATYEGWRGVVSPGGTIVTVEADRLDEVTEAVELYQQWFALFELLDDLPPEPGFALAADVRGRLRGFLEASVPIARWRRRLRRHPWVARFLPPMPRVTVVELGLSLRKNLAFLVGLGLLGFVLWNVEAVSSLVLNDGLWSWLPFALLALPVAASRLVVAWRVRRGAPQAFWDFGGPAFRRVGTHAREPGRPLRRWPPTSDLRRRIFVGHGLKMLGYLGWWLVSAAVIWGLGRAGLFSSTVLTVFLVLTLFYLVLLAGHVLDLWDYIDPLPVRALTLIVALSVVALLTLGWGHPVFILLGLGLAAFFGWRAIRETGIRRWEPAALAVGALVAVVLVALAWHTDRDGIWTEDPAAPGWQRLALSEWPHGGADGPPVVVVAASGGGSRAAVYTGLLFAELHRRPNADDLARHRTGWGDLREIAENLQAVASVSGGSLANAAYVARRVRDEPIDHRLPQDLAGDFLLPTLRGALWPFSSRGDEIERSWEGEGNVRLGELRLSELAERWRQSQAEPVPPFPVPLFNSSTLDGHAVVLSPLARDHYLAPSQGAAEELYARKRLADRLPPGANLDDAYTWVYYRDALYGLEDLLPHHDPRLAQAVRASANFPFGFPLIEIETRRRLRYNPIDPPDGTAPADRPRTVYLTDGGALSNSGMWSLYHLLTNQDLEPVLRRRGVLLILLEASKMPEYPLGGALGTVQRARSLAGAISDQAPVGQNLHHRMIDLLEARYGADRLAVVQLDLPPVEGQNVLTTWALARSKESLLRHAFARVWQLERSHLLESWRVLGGRGAPGETTYIARERPPLD